MEGFTFWRGYINTLKKAEPEDVKKVLIAMGDYVLDDKEPEIDGTAAIIFEAFRANLNKSKNRSAAGKTGGLKTAENNAKQTQANESKRKQTQSNEKTSEALITNNKKQITNNEEIITNNVGGSGGTPAASDTALKVFSEFADGNKDLMSALRGFAEMRTKIKKPLTARAAKLTLTDLKKLSTDPEEQIAILDQSVKRCWQGVFALDRDGGKNNGTQTSGTYASTGGAQKSGKFTDFQYD